MIIGIVGSEEIKFTALGRTRAFEKLAEIIDDIDVIKVVSGGCHLGGIDKWAIQVASEMGKEIEEYLPKKLEWEGGYKQRNQEIAMASDKIYCLTVDKLPEEYTGMRFEYCYHCHTDSHIKSGGCWTMKFGHNIGKDGELVIINNY